MPNVKVSMRPPSTRWRKSIVAFSGPVRNAALKTLHYILPLLLFQRRNLHVTFKLHVMGYIGLSSTLILLMEDGNPPVFLELRLKQHLRVITVSQFLSIWSPPRFLTALHIQTRRNRPYCVLPGLDILRVLP